MVNWKTCWRTSESSLVRKHPQFLPSWQEKTKDQREGTTKMMTDLEYRISEGPVKGVEITTQGNRLNEGSLINVLLVYEWVHLARQPTICYPCLMRLNKRVSVAHHTQTCETARPGKKGHHEL